jgi:hypothetical protein
MDGDDATLGSEPLKIGVAGRAEALRRSMLSMIKHFVVAVQGMIRLLDEMERSRHILRGLSTSTSCKCSATATVWLTGTTAAKRARVVVVSDVRQRQFWKLLVLCFVVHVSRHVVEDCADLLRRFDVLEKSHRIWTIAPLSVGGGLIWSLRRRDQLENRESIPSNGHPPN